jgi:hypothetical protein
MTEIDGKAISQLLLNPLFLLNRILGTIVPGALLIMLLGLKGNVLLRNVWLNPLFGYRTKLGMFVMLAFVIGSILRLPLVWVRSLLTLLLPKAPEIPAIKKMYSAVMTEGILLANPALIDRLSHINTDAAFHFVTGTAFLVAACVPGDGSLRYLEGLVGFGMLWAGLIKAQQYRERALNAVGIGLASIIATMTPQAIVAQATIKTLGLESKVAAEVPIEVTETVGSAVSRKGTVPTICCYVRRSDG